MIRSNSSMFSLFECENLKKFLKNPEKDFKEIISLLEKKVKERSKSVEGRDEKYQALIDGLTHVGIGIDIVGRDYEILFQNQVLIERFGDCSGKYCFSSYMGLEKPCEFCPMRDAIKHNRVERYELDAADGRSYELISAPYPNRDGTINKVAEVIIDITERRKFEQKLKESEEKYRNLFNNSPLGIFLFDEDGNLIEGNTFASNSFSGFSSNFSYGKNFAEILKLFKNSDELLPIFLKRKEDNAKGKELKPFEVKLERQDGETRWLHWQSSKIELKDKTLILAIVQNITERKIVEQELLKEKEFTETALDAQRDTFFVFEPSTGKAIRWNKAFSEISEYTDKEIAILRAPESYYSESEWKIAAEAIEKIENQGTAILEMSLITKSGKTIPFEYLGTSITDEKGNLKYVVSIGRDIRERREAEKKLKDTERFLSNIFTSIQDGICVLDKDFNIISTNPKIEEWFSYTKPLIGKKCFQVFRNKSEPCEDCECKSILTSCEPYIESELFKEIEGKIDQIFNVYTFPLLNQDVGDITGLIKYIREVTVQKEAEKKLKESEEKFRNITEESLLAIFIIQDNVVKYVNQEMANLYGYTVEEMLNWEPSELLKTVAPDSLEIVKEQSRKKQEGDLYVIIHYPIHCKKKNGELFWVDNISKTIIYEGQPADLITQIDITERISAHQELMKLNQLKSELLRRTSHELKTPLVSIKGFSDLLLELHRDELDINIISKLIEIKQGCLRLETLIGDILKTAELESGTIQLNESEEDLTFLIRLCVDEIKGLLILRKHDIDLKLPESLKTKFEKKQIHQVIANLLNNAIKYTPPGGLIEIKAEIKDDFILISIKDNGIGFIEEEKDRIFKQFGKIERYGKGLDVISEGSGLGLYISKKIIELHGGDIWVESEGRNRGSTFYFSLPVVQN